MLSIPQLHTHPQNELQGKEEEEGAFLSAAKMKKNAPPQAPENESEFSSGVSLLLPLRGSLCALGG